MIIWRNIITDFIQQQPGFQTKSELTLPQWIGIPRKVSRRVRQNSDSYRDIEQKVVDASIYDRKEIQKTSE